MNRVRDGWRDQLHLSGHEQRPEDLNLIAGLGVRALRYPVLWERTAPTRHAAPDFSWANGRLNALHRLGITPIVGLLHHGSGPSYTNLLDEDFARQFGIYAARVAEQFPWVRYYTPINEPLTTARFSGLYGHWYPHRRDDTAFVRCLMNQCRGIVRAMQNIRLFNPHAVLVQTEDLGTTHSTPHMRYQRDFDNERRWLTWDLLCGKVVPSHPLHRYLMTHGATRRELAELSDKPCPPGIIGVNHYVTSDRFLDETPGRYNPGVVGTNGVDTYADIEAVRALHDDYPGWRVLRSVWARYHVPIALTEVHIACTREEQMRWLAGAWRAAENARRAGCDIRAVTGWSLFGSFDWDSLLTSQAGHYDPGAFDIRASTPRPTAIASVMRDLAARGVSHHPALAGRGWWQHRSSTPLTASLRSGTHPRGPLSRSLLLIGPRTASSRAWMAACSERDLAVETIFTAPTGLPDTLRDRITEANPWAVVWLADAFGRPVHPTHETIRSLNAAVICDAVGAWKCPLLLLSSEKVFAGRVDRPYTEEDTPDSLEPLARAMAEVETVCLATDTALCVRSASVFGSLDDDDEMARALDTLNTGGAVTVDRCMVSPTYLKDLVATALDLLIDGCTGALHLVNEEIMSGAELLRRGAAAVGLRLEDGAIQERSEPSGPAVGRTLRSQRLQIMPSVDDALSRFAPQWPHLTPLVRQYHEH